jgi:hypothetical protein
MESLCFFAKKNVEANWEKKGNYSPLINKGPINLNKFVSKKVKSSKNLSLASNLYFFSIMRVFLINKNLCFYYWLKKRIGKTRALGVANTIEKIILILGREAIPYSNRDGTPNKEQ